jgi:hypothetical protein
MIFAAPMTIFGHFLRLDLQQSPEKRAVVAEKRAEFWRVKIDFRQNAPKLEARVAGIRRL